MWPIITFLSSHSFQKGQKMANHVPFSHGLHIRQSEIFLLLGRKMAQRAKSAQVCIVLPAKRLHPREKSTLYLDKRQTFCSFMFIWHFLNMFIEMRMAQNFIFHIKLPRILRQQFCYCNRGVSWSVHKACLLVGSGSIRSTCKETPESSPLGPQHILVAISPLGSNAGLEFHIDKEVRGQWTVHVTAHDEALWLCRHQVKGRMKGGR